MRNNNRVTFLLVLIVSIAGGGFAHEIRKRNTEREVVVEDSNGKTTVNVGAVSSIQMSSLEVNRQAPLPPARSDQLRLILFLSAADCGGCLTVVGKVNEVAKLHSSSLIVDAIFVRCSKNEAEQELRTIEPRFFKAYLDTTGEVASRANIPLKTPLAVLVDSEYRVRVAEGSTNNLESQQGFISAVTQIVEATR